MSTVSFLLFVIFVPLCFFTSFFYNKEDKFFKRFFKSLLYALCIGTISIFLFLVIDNAKYTMQDRYGYFSFPVKLFEFLSDFSLCFLAIIYNLVVLIAMKFNKN